MKKHLYLLALGLTLFESCGKKEDEGPLLLPGDYQTAATIATADIRMYTKNGPVNNPQLVDKFINRRQLGTSFFSRTDVPLLSGGSITLAIDAANQATLVYTSPPAVATDPPTIVTVKTRVIQQTPHYFVLANIDSTSYFNSTTYRSACDVLAEKINGVNKVNRCNRVSAATGYAEYCTYHQIRVVGINDGQLFVPQYGWLVQSEATLGSSGCSYAVGGSWNVFNPAVLNQLATGDTIVVQERTVALIKK